MVTLVDLLRIASLVLFTSGVVLFIIGFYFHQKKRLIQDTPKSKIRSLAMGLVEIYGYVVPIEGRILQSPFTEKPCVYYRYTIEEYRSTGKSANWFIIQEKELRDLFYLKDDTGMVLIDPIDATIETKRTYESTSGFRDDPPDSVQRYLAANNVAFKGMLGFNKTLRFREHTVVPEEGLYIMGTAEENPFHDDPLLNLGREHTVIRKGDTEKMFFISDKREWEIIRELNWNTAAGIGGGFICLVIGIILFVL
jgi:hypothetical protein